MQGLLGFTKSYRQVIRKYGKISRPRTELLESTEKNQVTWLKSAHKPERKPTTKWELTREVELAFQNLEKAFTGALILQHLDPAKPTILQTDTSSFAFAGILNRYHSFGMLRSVNFHSSICTPPAQDYDMNHRECLAIVGTVRQWRHSSEGTNYNISI